MRADNVIVEQGKFTTEWNTLLSSAISLDVELGQTYYKLTVPVLLKSRQWLKKLVRNIMSAAATAVPTQAVAMQDEDSRHLERITGTIDQREFVSLHAFLIRYATSKYNFPKLVQQLLLQLIVAGQYYKYSDVEVYVFMQFLTEQLPEDAWLFYK